MKSLVYNILTTIACIYCVWCMFQKPPFRSIQQFQQEEFIDDGYPLPKYGADGDLGDETETAWNAKFQAQQENRNE